MGRSTTKKLKMMSEDVDDFITTFDHNLEHDGKDTFLQLMVNSEDLNEEALGKLKVLSKKKAALLLKDIDLPMVYYSSDSEESYIYLLTYHISHYNYVNVNFFNMILMVINTLNRLFTCGILKFLKGSRKFAVSLDLKEDDSPQGHNSELCCIHEINSNSSSVGNSSMAPQYSSMMAVKEGGCFFYIF